jgi:hypothetical protein
MAAQAADAKKKEIYTYEAPWQIYGMNWSVRPDQKFRLAGMFVLHLRKIHLCGARPDLLFDSRMIC